MIAVIFLEFSGSPIHPSILTSNLPIKTFVINCMILSKKLIAGFASFFAPAKNFFIGDVSNLSSWAPLFAFSASFLSLSACFFVTLFCFFKVVNIELTAFRISFSGSLVFFLTLFFLSSSTSGSSGFLSTSGLIVCLFTIAAEPFPESSSDSGFSSGFFLSKKASGFIVVFFALNFGSAAFLDFLTFITSCDKIAERSSPAPLVWNCIFAIASFRALR